jgi:hypothetical protein
VPVVDMEIVLVMVMDITVMAVEGEFVTFMLDFKKYHHI